MNSLPVELLRLCHTFLDLFNMTRLRCTNKVSCLCSRDYSASTKTICVDGPLHLWHSSFPKLTHLNVRSQKKLTNDDFRNLSHITWLDLAFCDQDTISHHMFSYLPRLRYLDLKHSLRYMRDISFDNLIGLEELYISDNHLITDEGLQKLVNLKKLYLHNCSKITNQGLAKCTHLEDLDMYNMHHINDELCESLVNIKRLSLTFGWITTKGICHFKKLETLTMLSSCGLDTFKGFQDLVHLTYVNISLCSITDEDLKYISHVPKVALYGIAKINGYGFKYLTNVQYLDAIKMPLHEEPLQRIVDLRKLKRFNMYQCYVSPEIKEILSNALPGVFHTE